MSRAAVASMTGVQRFVGAAKHQPVDATPVWYMRQAGRSLARYRALREKYEILEMAKSPELSTQISLMAVDELDVDGAVLYADIMLPLEGMGVGLHIEPDIGPIIHDPISGMADVQRLHALEPDESVSFVMQVIRNLRQELGERAAVVGFCGAPYTLACYMIEGRPSRDYPRSKSLMLAQPDVWAALMDRLTDAMIVYLQAQVAAGAHVLQVFDSWVGALNPGDYERSVLPWSKRIFDALRPSGVPTIHFATGVGGMLPLFAAAGADLVCVDWRVQLDQAWQQIGLERGIQGNLDPVRVLAGWEATEAGARDILARAGGRPGHIFNLGHGVLPSTDPAILKRLTAFVHETSARA